MHQRPRMGERAASVRQLGGTTERHPGLGGQPYRNGQVVRRADARGTCIACNYLRNSVRISGFPLSATNTAAV